ncbi:MAG: WG repeat-containing protein [Deltaproteobacteria bacterium]
MKRYYYLVVGLIVFVCLGGVFGLKLFQKKDINSTKLFNINEKYKLENTNSNIDLKAEYEYTYNVPGRNVAIIKANGKWGLIDFNGKTLIKPIYDNMGILNEGLYKVKQNNKWKIINEKGDLITKEAYDGILPYNDGLAIVFNQQGKERRMGVVDKEGNEVVNLMYYGLVPFSNPSNTNGFITMFEEEGKLKCGLIDKMGKIVIEPKYNVILPLVGDFARIKKNNKLGFINRNGKEIVPPIYDDAKDFENGLAKVKLENKWIVIDEDGKKIKNID